MERPKEDFVRIINSPEYRVAEVIQFQLNMREAKARTVGDNVEATIYLMEAIGRQLATHAATVQAHEATIAELREALKFYADPETHLETVLGKFPIYTDLGAIARRALKSTSGGE